MAITAPGTVKETEKPHGAAAQKRGGGESRHCFDLGGSQNKADTNQGFINGTDKDAG